MIKPKLIIGNKNYSSWSLRGWFVLKHLGIEFDEVKIPLDVPRYKQKLYHYSDAGKVPVYIEDSLTIWDSLAICEYLAERHPLLWPVDAKARVTARCVSAEMHSSFLDLRNELPMNCRASYRSVTPSKGAAKDITRIENIWTSCRNLYASEGPWLLGGFSIADVMYAPVASRFDTYQIKLNSTAYEYMQTVLANPHIRQWYEDSRQEAEVIDEIDSVGV